MTVAVHALTPLRPFAGAAFGALAALALLLPAGPVAAAPQPLGLVATAEPVPMRCGTDGCATLLSSFCLQRERKSPNHDTPYHLAGGAGLSLHLVDAAGTRRTVPADGLVQLVSVRGNTGIEARLSAADMVALGAAEIAVEVGPLVTLLPEAELGDENPITPAEAEHAVGPARLLAADYFDSPAALGASINILDRAINAIGSDTRLTEAARRDLWTRVAGTPLEGADAPAEPAARVFAGCLTDLRWGMVYGLRNCLEGRRDELLIHTNADLWRALEAGS